MKTELVQAFTEQAKRLFSLCETYIDGTYSPDEKEPLLDAIKKGLDALDGVGMQELFNEITATLNEPMSDSQRERYCFSLITPFEACSNALYPKVLISKSQESIDKLQGLDGADKLISIFENQIIDAKERANKYFGLGFDADGIETGDEAKSIFFELAHIIVWYGNMLDAAFVMYGLDLKRLQKRCGVYIKQFVGGSIELDKRAMQISGYVGSITLAKEYLQALQPTEKDEAKEPQQGEQRPQEQPKDIPTLMHIDRERLVFGSAIEKGFMYENNGKYHWNMAKNLLAYMCGKLYCGDRVMEDKNTYNLKLKKTGRRLQANALKELFEGFDVANNRNAMNEPPTGYEQIDALFEEQTGGKQ